MESVGNPYMHLLANKVVLVSLLKMDIENEVERPEMSYLNL